MSEQFKTLHFWMGLVGVGIPAALEMNLIPANSIYARGAHLLMALLTYAGIQVAAKWMPARVIEKLDAQSTQAVPREGSVQAEAAKETK